MRKRHLYFGGFLSAIFLIAGFCLDVLAAQAPNPRSAAVSAVQRGDTSESRRAATPETISRSATRRNATVPITQGVVSNRAAIRQSVNSNRTTSAVSRSSVVPLTARTAVQSQAVRSATSKNTSVSRAASARATAVFDDVSKIGGGYASCRESYSTCMDQFCAKANDTYRRCFCSSKFTEFRDTEAALDQAKILLMRFEDNNLNAVDKTAAEVSAMYSATVGEAAIKNDTSAAQSVLNEIGELLSGKKKADNSIRSLNGFSIDFSADIGDIWGDNGNNDIFAGNNLSNLSQLEGLALYNAVDKQCTQMAKDSCDSNAVFTMARSSYGILITQDCNLYEKKINSQKESVSKTVREAEKILREARLEEYRAHNSSDVNECITRVKDALLAETACGSNYKRCLDWTGLYINSNTGEPIYSAHLQDLPTLIKLDNGADPIRQPDYNKFMDSMKNRATAALDTCRSDADVVWNEFKRMAMIEISQAQDEKIEQVKETCVSTMAECYDTQSNALASFDNTTAQASGALNAYAARAMCVDKVAACAAVYAPVGAPKCTFDSNTGKVTNGHACGLSTLQSFVQTVDNVKVEEGCAVALTNYAKDVCTPKSGDYGYPYDCRLRTSDELMNMLQTRADVYCKDPVTGEIAGNVASTIETLIEDINSEVENSLAEACLDKGGVWDRLGTSEEPLEPSFVRDVFGGTIVEDEERGKCVQNTERIKCEQLDVLAGGNGWATFSNGKCVFSIEWYKYRCEKSLTGTWNGSICYVD